VSASLAPTTRATYIARSLGIAAAVTARAPVSTKP